MNIEDTISRYIDGELSPGELAEFEEYLQQHPDVQQEIDEIRSVEKTLPALAIPLTTADHEFIRTTGEKLAEALPILLAGGTAAGVGIGVSSSGSVASTVASATGAVATGTGFSAPIFISLAAAVTTVVTSVVLLEPFSSDKKQDLPPKDSLAAVAVQLDSTTSVQDSLPTEIVLPDSSLQPAKEVVAKVESPAQPAPRITVSDKSQQLANNLDNNAATINGQMQIQDDQNQISASITQERNNLQQYSLQGNISGQAIAAFRLAKLHATLPDIQRASTYFEMASKFAEQEKNTSLLADICGEFALMSYKNNAMQQAVEQKKLALMYAEQTSSAKSASWQKRLASIGE